MQNKIRENKFKALLASMLYINKQICKWKMVKLIVKLINSGQILLVGDLGKKIKNRAD